MSPVWHRLFICVGVFLIAVNFLAHEQVAQASPLDGAVKTKLMEVEKIEAKVEKAEEQATAVAEAKESIIAEVDSVKAEIEELKVKLAEKKRLEALRVVNVSAVAPNSSGNTYAAGNCTWYAKSRRPDLPNRMGNAMYWYEAAKAAGFKTGTISKKGAIGVSFEGWAGHVVYVEEWYDDGTIKISDMNFAGLGVVTTRTAHSSEFVYIYEKT